MNQVFDELNEKVFARGDSAVVRQPSGLQSIDELTENQPTLPQQETESNRSKSSMDLFLEKFKKVIAVEIPFTVILDDPLSNSYIQNIFAPDEDPSMERIEYERSFDQNEDLGLNDINTENY